MATLQCTGHCIVDIPELYYVVKKKNQTFEAVLNELVHVEETVLQ